MTKLFSVGEVSKRCGVKVSTLHYYEQRGLISSYRNTGNQRRYKAEVIRRVSVIKAAQQLGISLESIKSAFLSLPENRTPSKKDWRSLSKRWTEELDARIKALQNLKNKMDSCIGCGCLSLGSCPLYNKDDHLASRGPGPALLNN